jgi:hypothetical protein
MMDDCRLPQAILVLPIEARLQYLAQLSATDVKAIELIVDDCLERRWWQALSNPSYAHADFPNPVDARLDRP